MSFHIFELNSFAVASIIGGCVGLYARSYLNEVPFDYSVYEIMGHGMVYGIISNNIEYLVETYLY